MRSIDSVKPVDMRVALSCVLLPLVLGCSSPTQRGDAQAQRAGFVRSIESGTQFRHLVYERAVQPTTRLTVFLEGDGVPWIGGRVPADDPTSRDPLALRLMIQSRGAALYVGRPCYHEVLDEGCSPRAWTFDRYSNGTVESMAAVIKAKSKQLGATDVDLIGYSGGGVLAVLIAERLQNVSRVVTIAANLDVDAWASHHRFLPLSNSLNPARSTAMHPWLELHLHGRRDSTVPIATTRAYFERYPNARQITFDDYDHVCCWIDDWDAVLEMIQADEGSELELPQKRVTKES